MEQNQAVTLELSLKQIKALQFLQDDNIEEVLFGGAAGGGKSWLISVWLISSLIEYPGSRAFLGRKVLKELKETTLLTFFQVADQCFHLKAGVDYKYNPIEGHIKFANESVLFLKELAFRPSDPEYNFLGSTEYTFGAVDEIQEIEFKAFETLTTRIRYKTEEFGIKGKILGGCNPSKNWLYEHFYRPFVKNELPPQRAFIQSLVTDNPKISKSYIEKLERISDFAMKQRLLLGNWDYEDKPNQLIPYAWIMNALVDKLEVNVVNKKLGVDLAREGQDDSFMVKWDDHVLADIQQISVIITEQSDIGGLVFNEIRDYSIQNGIGYKFTHADAVGVGASVIDSSRREKWPINEYKGGEAVPEIQGEINKYKNLRTYSYWKFREGLQNGMIKIYKHIPHLEELIRQLTAHEYQINDKMIILEEKKEVKKKLGKSPDISDATVIGYAPQPKKQFGFAFS